MCLAAGFPLQCLSFQSSTEGFHRRPPFIYHLRKRGGLFFQFQSGSNDIVGNCDHRSNRGEIIKAAFSDQKSISNTIGVCFYSSAQGALRRLRSIRGLHDARSLQGFRRLQGLKRFQGVRSLVPRVLSSVHLPDVRQSTRPSEKMVGRINVNSTSTRRLKNWILSQNTRNPFKESTKIRQTCSFNVVLTSFQR